MKLSSYSALSKWFEYLNDDCGYEQWSQYLIKKLAYPAGATGIDLGCGSGYFTRALTKAGYFVIGVDVSPEMLTRAQELALKEGVRTEFLLGDITKLTISPKRDFAVAVNDCINYVPAKNLKSAFRHVRASLKKGGKFIFDISSPEKLKNIIGNNLFAEDREDITYLWFNTLNGDSVTMDLTFFERGADGRYTRYDERHIQYIHSEGDILKELLSCGFTAECDRVIKDGVTERINFICTAI